jgi:hypothetical protein
MMGKYVSKLNAKSSLKNIEKKNKIIVKEKLQFDSKLQNYIELAQQSFAEPIIPNSMGNADEFGCQGTSLSKRK